MMVSRDQIYPGKSLSIPGKNIYGQGLGTQAIKLVKSLLKVPQIQNPTFGPRETPF